MVEGKTQYVGEHNAISQEDYRAHAKETLKIIKDTLSQSLGYYGSTSILEDNVLGNTVTKDGFTILNQIRFGPEDTISNTLLKMIQTISRSLVMEVGDGSTSAVVSSEALFTKLTSDAEFEELYGNIPPKVIFDKLNVIEKKVKQILQSSAVEINEDNFDKLKDIASVSNNNDSHSGNIIFEIYEKIGKNGFIILEKGYSEEDTYEVANGIETGYGLVSNSFTNKANGFESEYLKPKILMVNGQLDYNDIDWAASFMGNFWSKSPSTPLIFISTGYDTEFLNFLKINYQENSRKSNIQMGATVISSNKTEEMRDLAIYLGANLIDKSDDNVYQSTIDPFIKNDAIGINQFLNEMLGSCHTSYMNLNFSRFVEGSGSQQTITERTEHIQKEIDYIKEREAAHKDITNDLFRLEKRIGNLNSQVAKLYVTGNSETEIEARKFLFEDAIYASRSALEHGFISGGNLGVSRAIDVLLTKESDSSDEYAELERALAKLVKESFLEVYRTVLSNAYYTKVETETIVTSCLEQDTLYDVKSKKYHDIHETPIINSVMTDIRIMESVFSIIGLLVTSNQYIQKLPRVTTR